MIPPTSNMIERQQHRDGDSGDLWQSSPLQQLDDRREKEGQKHRKRDGYEHIACEIEGRHDHNPGREPKQRFRLLRSLRRRQLQPWPTR